MPEGAQRRLTSSANLALTTTPIVDGIAAFGREAVKDWGSWTSVIKARADQEAILTPIGATPLRES
jgi:hypothetical protein